MADANTTEEEIKAIEQVFLSILNTLNEATNVGQNAKLFGWQHMVFFDNTRKIKKHWENKEECCNYVAIDFNSSTPQGAIDLISQLAKDSGFTVVKASKTLLIEVNRGENFQESYNLENATKLLELVEQNERQFSKIAIEDAFSKISYSQAAKLFNQALKEVLKAAVALLGASTAAAAAPAAEVPTPAAEPEISA